MRSNLTTLCYIDNGDSYLMMHRVKKENDVNKDKWVGVGGHFEADESPEECLCREVYEETGLTLTAWKFRGIVTFISSHWPTEYMCLYTSDEYTGEMRACSEGNLEWVKKDEVYDLPVWEGDKIFFRLLEERDTFFSLKLVYEEDTLAEAVLDGKALEIPGTVQAVDASQEARLTAVRRLAAEPTSDNLWDAIVQFEGCPFHTAKGLEYTYTIKGYEMFVDRKDKSITKSTVDIAFEKALELEGIVKGPKKLGCFGASYIYPIFIELGVIRVENEQLQLKF